MRAKQSEHAKHHEPSEAHRARHGRAAAPAMSVAEAAQIVNEVGVDIVAKAVEENQQERSPFAYYKPRVEANSLLAWYDPIAADLVAQLPPMRAYHEIGAGIGVLTLMLGLRGGSCVAMDVSPDRVALGQSIADRIKEKRPRLNLDVRFVHGEAPMILDTIDTKGALCISTDMAAARPDDYIDAYLEAIRRYYRAYLFDASILHGNRRGEGPTGEFIKRAAKIFGREPRRLYEKKNYAEYWYVDFA